MNSLTQVLPLLLAWGTKLGAAVAAYHGFQFYERGGEASPAELATYLGGPLAAGAAAEIVGYLVNRLKAGKSFSLDYIAAIGFLQGLKRYFANTPEGETAKAHIDALAALAWSVDARQPLPDADAGKQLADLLERLKARKTTVAAGPTIGLLLCLSMMGCNVPDLPDKPEPVKPDVILPIPDPDVPDKVKPLDLLRELADMIPSKVKTVDDLLRLITIAKDGGDWPDEASTLVDKALPGVVKEKRALTVEDAKRLREVK